jgi:hypothetical protein
MGIVVQYPKSECSTLVRKIAELFRDADEVANECMRKGDPLICRRAENELDMLDRSIKEALDKGCVKDVEDFRREVIITKERVKV